MFRVGGERAHLNSMGVDTQCQLGVALSDSCKEATSGDDATSVEGKTLPPDSVCADTLGRRADLKEGLQDG